MKSTLPIFTFVALLLLISMSPVMAAPDDREAVTYQTKPRTLETGNLFFLMFSPKHKQLAYEPCVGFHTVEMLKETPTEFVIRIAGTQGRSLDPLTGQETKVSELKGKIYLIEVAGRAIHRISEAKPNGKSTH